MLNRSELNDVLFVLRDVEDRIKKGLKPDYIVFNRHTYYLVLSYSPDFPMKIREKITPDRLFGIPIVIVANDNSDLFVYKSVYKN